MKQGKSTRHLLAVLLAVMLAVTQVFATTDTRPYAAGPGGGEFPADRGSFDFDGNYEAPELKVDGKADDPEWGSAPVFATFGNSTHSGNVTAKAWRGQKAMFFFFAVTDNCLLTYTNNGGDDVNKGDSVELYINTLESEAKCTGYQINLGVNNKTRIMLASGALDAGWSARWGSWNGLIDYEIFLNGTLEDGNDTNDTGYGVEVMVPYGQIGITNQDPVGVALGRVDRFNDAGATAGVHWDWYGWSYSGHNVDPQIPTTYPIYMPDGTLIDRDTLPKPAATVGGTVTEQGAGTPIAGVAVKEGETLVATTGEDGRYAVSGVNPELSHTYTFEKDGYYPVDVTAARAELRAANGGLVTKNMQLINSATAPKSTIQGTVKNIVNGVVGNATVAIKNTSIAATTAADGTFSIPDAPITDGATLLISKSGHVTEEVVKAQADFNDGAVTALGDLNLSLNYNTQGAAVGGAAGCDSFGIKITRTLTGVRFVLTTTTKFEKGNSAATREGVILYLHSGALPTANKAFAPTFWADGATPTYDKTGTSWASPSLAGVTYTVVGADEDTGATVTVNMSYDYFRLSNTGFAPTDVFGFSAGVQSYNSSGTRVWDGFGYDGFIDPMVFTGYVRVAANNSLYKADSNNTNVTASGTVYGKDDAPVSGAAVTLGAASTTTDAQGAYSLTFNKPSSDQALTVKADGYEWGTQTLGASDFASSLAKTANFNLTERLNTVTGYVKNIDGVGIEGVTVEAKSGVTVINSAVTDASGAYGIANVTAYGELTIAASKEGAIG
ncbi:MAG: hypothetical protein LBP26_06520, partial [Clostridiales bacterium]|nr:hypothetical protein [Clostridiales bacterium]